ncbi:MAG TPA: nucleoside hydrolase [Terriglobia bacterium]|nr:nucleoside hydrolase [Terriglobia bacterium]
MADHKLGRRNFLMAGGVSALGASITLGGDPALARTALSPSDAQASLPIGNSAERQKIILDTDIGTDIDDAFALALILSSPEFELLGVTTDHGLTQKRAQIVCRMLYEAGRDDVPVAVGRQTPQQIGKDTELAGYWSQFHWGEGFTKKRPADTPAADFIIETLRKYPHEVTLFLIGPMPNIGDILKKDPDALKLAKHIYAMFGSFNRGYDQNNYTTNQQPPSGAAYSVNPVPSAEYNVAMDVESAKLFAASGAAITYAPLDINTFLIMPEDDQDKIWRRRSPLTDALGSLHSLWSTGTPSRPWVVFDCSPVGIALWPDLFTTRPAHVRVIDGGFTVIDESKPANSEIAQSINKDEFLNRLLKRYIYQTLGRP